MPEGIGGFELTQVGFQPSTLLYSSPEQVLGQETDARSDVYQLGALLYYMLVGRHYIDLTMLEALAVTHAGASSIRSQAKIYELLEIAICEQTPAGMKDLWREVGALAEIVEIAMAKKKEQRFAHAGEFAAALKNLSINTIPASVQARQNSLLDSRAYTRRGLAHVSTRNYEQAIVDYSKAIKLDPHNAEAYNNRSTAHLLMGNFAQAVLDCQQAIAEAPDFVAAYVNRGIAHTGLRQYQDAQEDYRQAIELDPRNVYAYYNLGNTFIWMSDYRQAIDYYSQTIALDPEFVAAYVNRGVAHNELNQYAEALADFSRAIEINPDYVHAYYNRATANRETRQYEAAVADYTNVIRLNPKHPHVYDNRGDVYIALGKEDEATEDYARIISNITTIPPKRLTVAASMIMPPLRGFLTRR